MNQILSRNVCNNITHLPEDCEIHETESRKEIVIYIHKVLSTLVDRLINITG